MTIKEYLVDPSVLDGEVVVTALIAQEQPVVRTKATWFHPQGGGQKADRGKIGAAAVSNVRHVEGGEVDHFVAAFDGLVVGERYPFHIDPDWRRLNARYHSAGHLIASVCERAVPGVVATNGHQWPGEARVEFGGTGLEGLVSDLPALEAHIKNAIDKNLAVCIVGDPFLSRAIKMGDYAPIPCGGTHVTSTREIGGVRLRSAKIKGGIARLGYELL